MTSAISRILVPLDFSPHSEDALQYAIGLATRLAARLELLHVVEDPFAAMAMTPEAFLPNIPELVQNVTQAAEHQLTVLQTRLANAGIGATTAVVTGRPAQAIVDYAREGRFDLIVMSTHGRTGVAHVVMGSVAERVVQRATCPVLTVRAAAT